MTFSDCKGHIKPSFDFALKAIYPSFTFSPETNTIES
jgi:hypothetical protein